MSTLTPIAAELAELQHTLIRHGFVRCDIAACNCGGWHARYGLRQQFDEIVQALSDAGHPLTNDNGNLALNALGELVAERDAMRAALAQQVPVWECKAGGLRPLTQAQYEKQTDAVKRHYSRAQQVPEPTAWRFASSYWTRRESIPAELRDEAEPLYAAPVAQQVPAVSAWRDPPERGGCWLNGGKCIEPDYCGLPSIATRGRCAKNDTRAAPLPTPEKPA